MYHIVYHIGHYMVLSGPTTSPCQAVRAVGHGTRVCTCVTRIAPLCCIGTRHAVPSQAPHASPLCHDARARDGCVLRSGRPHYGVDIIRTGAGCQACQGPTTTTTTTQLSLVRSITAHEAQSSSARCCHTHQRQGWPASHGCTSTSWPGHSGLHVAIKRSARPRGQRCFNPVCSGHWSCCNV
jgi:hypothetical protein